MKCTECENGHLVRGTKAITYKYKNRSYIVMDVPGFFCDSCSNNMLEPDVSEDISKHLLAFRKQVNQETTGQFIEQIRKDLAVSRSEAGRIFGGGINAFKDYETGDKKPPQALLQLMGLIHNHPDLLSELRAAAAEKDSRFHLAA